MTVLGPVEGKAGFWHVEGRSSVVGYYPGRGARRAGVREIQMKEADLVKFKETNLADHVIRDIGTTGMMTGSGRKMSDKRLFRRQAPAGPSRFRQITESLRRVAVTA